MLFICLLLFSSTQIYGETRNLDKKCFQREFGFPEIFRSRVIRSIFGGKLTQSDGMAAATERAIVQTL
jgi:hypothetical protein